MFTDTTDENCQIIDTKRWKYAYDSLLQIVRETTDTSPEHSPLRKLNSILLRDSHDIFLAWMLVCFVPWAKEPPKPPKKASTKKQPSPAYFAAREGIKADNKICKVVDAAVHCLQEVIDLKNSIGAQQGSGEADPKQKPTDTRAIHGQAIRAWGSEWRSIVIFALLTEAMELGSPDGLISVATIKKKR